jgi:hypothetical protein
VGAHTEASYNCHVSQLAGSWWADLLCLGDIINSQRRIRALKAIFALNVASVPGCPADERAPDGTYTQSMAAVSMANFAAQAIAAGLPDLGWEAVERVYRVRYERDGSPWDAPLQWAGQGNVEPQWGRWYMSHPSSWYVLLALGGVRIDRLRNTLSVVPHWPTTWGDTLAVPVFLPGFYAEVHGRRGSAGWGGTVRLKRSARHPVLLDSIVTQLPQEIEPATVRAEASGIGSVPVHIASHGQVQLQARVTLARKNDQFSIFAV